MLTIDQVLALVGTRRDVCGSVRALYCLPFGAQFVFELNEKVGPAPKDRWGGVSVLSGEVQVELAYNLGDVAFLDMVMFNILPSIKSLIAFAPEDDVGLYLTNDVGVRILGNLAPDEMYVSSLTSIDWRLEGEGDEEIISYLSSWRSLVVGCADNNFRLPPALKNIFKSSGGSILN